MLWYNVTDVPIEIQDNAPTSEGLGYAIYSRNEPGQATEFSVNLLQAQVTNAGGTTFDYMSVELHADGTLDNFLEDTGLLLSFWETAFKSVTPRSYVVSLTRAEYDALKAMWT